MPTSWLARLATSRTDARTTGLSDPTATRASTEGAYLFDLLDELFANLLHLIVAGLILVGVAVAAASFVHVGATPQPLPNPAAGTAPISAPSPTTDSSAPLIAFWTATLVTMSLHYVFTLLLCVKRLRRAHEELTI